MTSFSPGFRDVEANPRHPPVGAGVVLVQGKDEDHDAGGQHDAGDTGKCAASFGPYGIDKSAPAQRFLPVWTPWHCVASEGANQNLVM